MLLFWLVIFLNVYFIEFFSCLWLILLSSLAIRSKKLNFEQHLLMVWLCTLSSLTPLCRLGKDFPLDSNSGLFRCAICQADQSSSEGLSVNSGPVFSPASKPWAGPFLCDSCRRKKDAMEGKRPIGHAITA